MPNLSIGASRDRSRTSSPTAYEPSTSRKDRFDTVERNEDPEVERLPDVRRVKLCHKIPYKEIVSDVLGGTLPTFIYVNETKVLPICAKGSEDDSLPPTQLDQDGSLFPFALQFLFNDFTKLFILAFMILIVSNILNTQHSVTDLPKVINDTIKNTTVYNSYARFLDLISSVKPVEENLTRVGKKSLNLSYIL